MINMFDVEEFDYERARMVREDLEQLFSSAGWQILTDFIQARVRTRERELISQCPASTEQMVAFARIRGGLDELLQLPLSLAAMHSELMEFIRQVQDEEAEAQAEFDLSTEGEA